MFIGVMKKGDHVISVTNEFVAIERKSGEVDIIPIIHDGDSIRIDTSTITTIGFGDNIIQSQVGDVTITTF